MNIKINIVMVFGIMLLAAFGCEKADSDKDFGSTNVYILQATTANGYDNVPSGNDSSTYNYTIDQQNKKVNVLLGVYRSGKFKREAFTVDIMPNADTVTSLINKGVLASASTIVMPSTVFTLPAQVAVKNDENTGSFYLSADIDKLKTFAGKKLAIGVTLTNTSRYTLLPSLNTVIVVMDIDALNL